jgi:AcrR family transcriptional regulator
MPAATPAAEGPRRRGPRPRHTRQDVVLAAVAIADADGIERVTFRAVAARLGVGVMSLYNYVPDKQALVYDMVAEVAAELRLPEPTGDWRADMHRLAHEQRALLHRHPWMVTESSHLQPLGPAVLALIEWALGVLEPTGLTAPERLETIAMLNWFVGDMVRGELATRAAPPPESEQAAAQAKQLAELLATGRYPRFAAAVTQSSPPDPDLRPHFDRILDRILDGLIGPAAVEDGGESGPGGQGRL